MNGKVYRRVAILLGLTIAVLGFALLITTALHGGGTSGYIIGGMFVALGSGRFYLLMKRR